jgi:putative endonuclease
MKAIKYEKQIKGWSRVKKSALINYDFKQLHELAICRNTTTHENYMVRVSEAER